MITRLQLGASRLEHLEPRVLQTFLNKTWVHFGDPEDKNEKGPLKGYTVSYFIELFRRRSISYLVNKTFKKLFRYNKKGPQIYRDQLYNKTNFKEFYYQKGNLLPFDDCSLNFIFSEHFFEHLFFDEALSLLNECHRILKPFAVIRTCVPDADLRTYESPEPVGYPSIKLSYTEQGKHKTRWSVYSLMEAIKIAGFEVVPLRYCNKSGEYIQVNPSYNAKTYENCPEREMIFEFSYIKRIDSLIVDGIKIPLK